MKKYLSLLLALVMTLSLCACNDDEESPTLEGGNANNSASSSDNAAGTSTNVLSQFSGKLIEPTMKIIASGSYMYEINDTSTNSPITFATVGGKTLLTFEYAADTPGSFINMNGKYYLLSSSQSAYGEITSAVASKYGISLDYLGQLFEAADLESSGFLSCSYKASGTATIGSATYNYEDYYNPIAQHTRRFFFDDAGTLAYMTTVNSDGTQGSLSSISLYTATDSVFAVLDTYQLVDLNSETGTTASTATAQ